MALTQENVHYTLNSGPGVMNKANRVHARIQEFLSGGRGGGGGGSRPNGQKTFWTMFFSHQLILQFTEWIQWFYYRGEEGVQLFQGLGVSKETHITCDFPGVGSGPPNPPLDPHVGSPDATVCLKESWSGTPWKITSYMGFYRV